MIKRQKMKKDDAEQVIKCGQVRDVKNIIKHNGCMYNRCACDDADLA